MGASQPLLATRKLMRRRRVSARFSLCTILHALLALAPRPLPCPPIQIRTLHTRHTDLMHHTREPPASTIICCTTRTERASPVVPSRLEPLLSYKSAPVVSPAAARKNNPSLSPFVAHLRGVPVRVGRRRSRSRSLRHRRHRHWNHAGHHLHRHLPRHRHWHHARHWHLHGHLRRHRH